MSLKDRTASRWRRSLLFITLVLMLMLSAANFHSAQLQTGAKHRISSLPTAPNLPGQRVHQQIQSDERILVASDQGLLAYDGSGWQTLINEETFTVNRLSNGRLLAGTGAGVLLSDDQGEHWRNANLGLSEKTVPLVISVSAQHEQIYLGSDRHGIFRSDDLGNSWQPVNDGLPQSIGVSPFASIKRIVISPDHPSLIFAATDAQGIYFSQDSGTHWQPAMLALPGKFYHRVNAPFITFDQSAHENIYALVNFPVHSELIEHSIHFSNDGGSHWALLGKLPANQAISDFSVNNGVATVTSDQGIKTINLQTLSLTDNSNPLPEPTPNAVIPGTEPDFDSDDIAILHDDNGFVSIAAGDLNRAGMPIAKRFYQRHGDDYDLIIMYTDPLYAFSFAGSAFAYNVPIFNPTFGIGFQTGIYNGGPLAFGSTTGRLRSFSNLNNIGLYPEDAKQSFIQTYNTLDILGLEVGHTWGAFLHFDDNGVTSDELLNQSGGNWSFFFNSEASFLSGNQYLDLGSGSFRTNAASSRYNQFDQYAMGLNANPSPSFLIQKPTSFNPNIVLGGVQVDPTKPEARNLPPIAPPEFSTVTVAGTRKDVTLADIVKVEGPRMPATDSANIKMAFVYIVPPGREPFDDGLDHVKAIRKAWVDFFKTATGGLGNADTSLIASGGSDTKAPVVKVIDPNGGDSIAGGSTLFINWDVSDENGIAKQDIDLSLDGGATYSIKVARSLNGQTKSFLFTLPPSVFSDKARVQITAVDYAGNKTVDASDKDFSIKKETEPPTVKIMTPRGGEDLIAGKNFQITWTSSDNGQLQSHDINLSTDGGKNFDNVIISGLPGRTQDFIWRIPTNLSSDQARIQVVARDTAGNVGSDISNFFAIDLPDNVPPTVKLFSPVGGESLQAGGTFKISWTSSDNVRLASHELSFSTDGGRTFDGLIASGLPATAQDFLWKVPNIESNTARVRIVAIDAQNNKGMDSSSSDLVLTKNDVTPPTVTVISPNGGETARAGEPLSIQWQISDNVAVKSQKISLSTDGGQSFPILVADNLSGSSNSFTFMLPTTIQSTQARIEVAATDTSNNVGRDSSDASFTIAGVDTIAPVVKVLSPNGGEVADSSKMLRIAWQASDNAAVTSQDVLISIDGGANYTTLQSGLDGSVQELTVNVSTLLSERAKVKIVARDRNNNVGSDESDAVFAIANAPAIKTVRFSNNGKKLTISASGISATTQVTINGRVINGVKMKFNAQNGTLVLKGDRSQLNLQTGDNIITVTERGLVSTAFKLIL